MDEEPFSIFYGFGSCFDLRDQPQVDTSRLDGLRSVSSAARRALCKPKPPKPGQPIGYRHVRR